jgi:hypothetical protein
MPQLMKTPSILTLIGLLAFASIGSAAEVDLSKLPPPSKQKGVTYVKEIQPILTTSCLPCHGGDRPKADLRVDSLETLLKGSKEGKVIVPGKSDKSLLVIAVSQLDEEKAMPPKPGARGHGPGGPPPPGGARPPGAGAGAPPQGPGGERGGFTPPKPLTPEQVGLVRAWIDQGAK